VATVEDHLGDGSLGTVEVGSGEEIQIRSLNAISGDVAFLGVPNQRGVELAIRDYGPIGGHDVTIGTGLDDLCSADGGQAAAQMIVADEDVVGVIGTSCSGAATAASPLISEAGMVMISGSNTSPALTSDLAGTAGPNYNPGYYRTAHNDLYQGAAAASFAIDVLGVSTAAAIHDGDPYTQGLAQAFADAFEAGGGTITGFTAVNKGDTDMVPVLTEIAAGSPEMLFFPIFQPEGDFIIQQVTQVAGLGGTTMMAADGLLNSNYMALGETEGMYFSGPDIRYGTNYNQATGQTADAFLAAYNDEWGEDPAAPFWAHSYDATTLLLDAIAAASYDDGGTLVIDRAGVREFLNSVADYSGIIGLISCDAFGDCGSQKITVIGHADSTDVAASNANVIYEYAPGGSKQVGAVLDASGASTEIPEAKQLLDAMLVRPNQLQTTEQIAAPVPEGKVIDWVVCGVPECAALTQPLTEAAEALGWSVNAIDGGLSPETVQAAWDLAVQNGNDAVVGTGFPSVMFATQLAQLEAAGVPVVQGYVTEPAGNGIIASIAGGDAVFTMQGSYEAQFVLGRIGTEANTLFLGGSVFPGMNTVQNGFEAEYLRLCPSCTFDALDLPGDSIGTTLPSTVVAYLTTHPDVNYLVLGMGSMLLGLPEALEEAGLDLKIVANFPNEVMLQQMRDGIIDGIIMLQQADSMWQMVDALARFYAGESVEPSMAPSPVWAITAETADQLTAEPYALVEGYQDQYKALWGR